MAGAIPFDTVYDLIRESEENGNQHIFYFKFAGQPRVLSPDQIATLLWGQHWKANVQLPAHAYVEQQFIYADLRLWNPKVKPRDWALKIYGHELIDRATDEVEVIDEHRYKRVFVKEPRRSVILVRWNDPDLLEIRVPQNTSKRIIESWVRQAWLKVSPALKREWFIEWDLRKTRRKLGEGREQHATLYSCSTTEITDSDNNVATFRANDPQGHLLDSDTVNESMQTFAGRKGDHKNMRVNWLPRKDGVPTQIIGTLLGHNADNEIVVTVHCSSRDVDYVTNQLRHFGR